MLATLAAGALLVACSASDDFHAPQIASVTPERASPGTVVSIAGSYFCHQQANEDPLACSNVGAVAFGQLGANVTEYSDGEVMAEVPAGAGAVEITVTVVGQVSNPVAFTIE
jgi:hypothetical protein